MMMMMVKTTVMITSSAYRMKRGRRLSWSLMIIDEFLSLTSTQVPSPVLLCRVTSGSLSIPSWKSYHDSPFASHSASGAPTWDNPLHGQAVILSAPDWNFNMLASLWIVSVLFLRTGSFSWSTFSATLFIDGHPEHSSFSAEVIGFRTWNTTQEFMYFPFSTFQKLLSALQKYL